MSVFCIYFMRVCKVYWKSTCLEHPPKTNSGPPPVAASTLSHICTLYMYTTLSSDYSVSIYVSTSS